jgi:hypothetical protein
MKNLYILLILSILINSSAFGQIEKGKMLIGGGLNFASSSGGSATTFSPVFGYMFTDNIMGGTSLNTGSGYTQFIPFVRYYKPLKEQIYGFGTVSYNLSSPNQISLGVGVNYFIKDNVSLEPILSFTHSGMSDSYTASGYTSSVSTSENTFKLGMGIQFFF